MELDEGILFHGRYKLLKNLGHGSFGEVWLANDVKMGKDVAIKIYIALDDEGLEDFKIEIKNTYDLNHPNLIHANHYDDCDGRPYLVMPYCSNGSASNLPDVVDEKTVWRFIRDVASGLAYLHNRKEPVIHQDIKPANILIDDSKNFLITDFGLSKALKNTMSQQSERAVTGGTVAFMAPERFSKTPITIKASDIFSLGVSAYYIVMGILPFAAQGGIALFSDKVQVPDIDTEKYSKELNKAICSCMAKEAWNRPTAEELVEYANAQLKGEIIQPAWENRGEEIIKEQADVNIVPEPTPKPKLKYIGYIGGAIAVIVIAMLLISKLNGDKSNGQDEIDNNIETSSITADWAPDITKEQKHIIEDLINNMVEVHGDTFYMGAQSTDRSLPNYDIDAQSDEAPVHKVVLNDYYICKYEVTQDLWQAIMKNNPSQFNNAKNPVEKVSYNDCIEFIDKLNVLSGLEFALPTEAQWEYAAGGGCKSDGYRYSGSNIVGNVAWFGAGEDGSTNTVGGRKANELGLYDMSGNVWEWCSGYYSYYGRGLLLNPSGSENKDGDYRVIRGGAWNNDAKYCRISIRYFNRPDYSDTNLGFRLVLNKN